MVPTGFLLTLVLTTAAGCSLAVGSSDTAAPAPGRTVRVSSGEIGSTIRVRVGDVLKVERPANYDAWNVEFSRGVLRSLNTNEGRRTPPADGWTFAVVASGSTQIVFTPEGARGNTRRFLLTIDATP